MFLNLVLLLPILAVVIQRAHCQTPDVREFCTKVLSNPFDPCDVAQCQGRPGKRGVEGKRGIAGQKGQKGDRGPGFENVERSLEALEEKVREDEKMVTFNFCALGMKSRQIPDAAITTSSNLNAASAGPFARLDGRAGQGGIGAWCTPRGSTNQWIQIDLEKTQPVSGLVTQGNPSSDDWITSYTVSCRYQNGAFNPIKENGIPKVFKANSDRHSKAVNMFQNIVACRTIRVHPKSAHGKACLRMELLRGSCHSPKRYSIYVESAGYEDGNTCDIVINGVNHAIKSRGHCVAILDMTSGRVTAQTFDTYNPETKITDMMTFLKAAPMNSLIAIAVRDATNPDHITDEAVALLRKLGAVGIACPIKIAVRDSWSFITQKVQPGVPRPSWVKCQHVPRYGGRAAVHVTATESAFYPSWEELPLA